MRSFLLPVLFILIFLNAVAQQRDSYTQYLSNPFVLHPALTGHYEYASIMAGYRVQGLNSPHESYPSSFYISGHTFIGRGKYKPHTLRERLVGYHNVGGIVNKDQTGPSERMAIMANYAFNMRFYSNWRLSLGLSLGAQHLNNEGNRLYFKDSLPTGMQGDWLPDGSIGFWLYSKKAFVGGTLTQLFQSRLSSPLPISTDGSQTTDKLPFHGFLTAGVCLDLAHDWSVHPSALLKFTPQDHLYADFNAKLDYRNKAFLTASYRNMDSFAFLIGVVIARQWEIQYLYDFSNATVPYYTANSHEITLGIRLWPRVGTCCNFW